MNFQFVGFSILDLKFELVVKGIEQHANYWSGLLNTKKYIYNY